MASGPWSAVYIPRSIRDNALGHRRCTSADSGSDTALRPPLPPRPPLLPGVGSGWTAGAEITPPLPPPPLLLSPDSSQAAALCHAVIAEIHAPSNSLPMPMAAQNLDNPGIEDLFCLNIEQEHGSFLVHILGYNFLQ